MKVFIFFFFFSLKKLFSQSSCNKPISSTNRQPIRKQCESSIKSILKRTDPIRRSTGVVVERVKGIKRSSTSFELKQQNEDNDDDNSNKYSSLQSNKSNSQDSFLPSSTTTSVSSIKVI